MRARQLLRLWSVPAVRRRRLTVDFTEWYDVGLKAGWIAEGVCQTRDMVQMTPEEEIEFDAGGDPCIPVIRVWTEKV